MTNHTDLLISYRDLMRRAMDALENIALDNAQAVVDRHISELGEKYRPRLLQGYRNEVKVIEKLITDLRTAIETGGWLPIEMAPRDGTFVLCLHKSGYVNIQQFCSMGYWRSSLVDESKRTPAKWMPLPPPPNSPSGSE